MLSQYKAPAMIIASEKFSAGHMSFGRNTTSGIAQKLELTKSSFRPKFRKHTICPIAS